MDDPFLTHDDGREHGLAPRWKVGFHKTLVNLCIFMLKFDIAGRLWADARVGQWSEYLLHSLDDDFHPYTMAPQIINLCIAFKIL